MRSRWAAFTVVLAATAFVGGVAPSVASTRTQTPQDGATLVREAGIRLATGDTHSCFVNGDGTVRCWGQNAAGQLGNGTTTNALSPVTVTGLTGAVAVSAGGIHTCALIADGTVQCWGNNRHGQLGASTTTTSVLSPVRVSGLTGVVAIAAGASHTCALQATGLVQCWGANGTGQVGDGTLTDRFAPVPVLGESEIVALGAGDAHTCALTSNGTVDCWGDNTFGQQGVLAVGPLLPHPVRGLGSGFTALAVGGKHTCVLSAFGGAECWGNNSHGQLGDGTSGNIRTVPVAVGGLIAVTPGPVALTAGFAHTCALYGNGSATCWGANDFGELGDGTTTLRVTPTAVLNLSRAVALAGGGAHSCALLLDGTASCWGANSSGQLGTGSLASTTLPTGVSGISGSISGRGIWAGGDHTCARRGNSTAACWGYNGFGQLGNNTTANALLPGAVQGLASGYQSVVGGEVHTCAVRVGGSAVCWGDNSFGQLGIGTSTTTAQLTPGPSALLPGNAVAVSAGSNHTCALSPVAGFVLCWGSNEFGQLGDGTGVPQLTPVFVGFGAIAIAVGGNHSCALGLTGQASCWGSNSNGQLGDGTTTDRNLPVPVALGGVTDVVALAAGVAHTCALRANGTVLCWGANNFGQLGTGTLTSQVVPQIPVFDATTGQPLANVKALAAGAGHTCALIADGTVRCWGRNDLGQLGDGTQTQRLSPVPVLTVVTGVRLFPFFGTFTFITTLGGVGSVGVTALAAGGAHTCALLANGQPFCWGLNGTGQLGDGTTTERLTAVAVPSFSFNIDPAVGLAANDRVATVTALVDCPAGERAEVRVTLTQGETSGQGVGGGACTGGLARYPVTVPAVGSSPFELGAADAAATAIIRQLGHVVSTEEWTRAVALERTP